jgi:hypothetical protein
MKYFIGAVLILGVAFFIIDSALSEKSVEVVGIWDSDEITISPDQVQLERHEEWFCEESLSSSAQIEKFSRIPCASFFLQIWRRAHINCLSS